VDLNMSVDNDRLFLEASELWEGGRTKRAFALFLDAATRGDASSQHNLAYFYDEGVAVKQDKAKALYWYKRALRTDPQPGTCSNIAILHAESGNRRRARYWWNRAIAMGDGDAALELARYMLSNGNFVEAEVRSLLRFAIDATHVTPHGVEEAGRLLKARMKLRS
jgi:TPR repeat protein